jgi:hypothetical protein
MKMRILGCQPRSGKDPWNRTYCRCKKIRVSTESQDLPPAIVLKKSKFLAILRGPERIWARSMACSIIDDFRCLLPFNDCVQSFDAGVEMRTPGKRDCVSPPIRTGERVSLIRTQQLSCQALRFSSSARA